MNLGVKTSQQQKGLEQRGIQRQWECHTLILRRFVNSFITFTLERQEIFWKYIISKVRLTDVNGSMTILDNAARQWIVWNARVGTGTRRGGTLAKLRGACFCNAQSGKCMCTSDRSPRSSRESSRWVSMANAIKLPKLSRARIYISTVVFVTVKLPLRTATR